MDTKSTFVFFPELSIINHVSQSSSVDVAVFPHIWPPVILWLKFIRSRDDNYSCFNTIFSSQYRFCILPALCGGYIMLWLDILCDTPSRILQEAFTSCYWCQNNPNDNWAAISVATVWDIHCIITMSDIIAVSRYYNKCYYRQYSEIKTNGCFELNRHLMKISQFIMCWQTWNTCRHVFLKEIYYALSFLSFPPVFYICSCICKWSWKLKKSTEAPLSHRKHCSWNASSVVSPSTQIQTFAASLIILIM